MAIVAKENSDYVPIPEGSHRAVCSGLADLGLQESFGKTKHQIVVRFEFPDERTDENEPRTKWQFYTLSLHKESNLRRDLEGWRNKSFTPAELDGFEMSNVLGHACQITIIHDLSSGQLRDKIRNITALAGEKLKPELGIVHYHDERTDDREELPEWVQDKIRGQIVVSQPAATDPQPELNDDLPFNKEAA